MSGTSGQVAQHATIRNAVNTREITLLGVVDTPGERRALVRLPSGRIRTLREGDVLNGGRVVTIGAVELHFHKANHIHVLTLPP